MNVEANKACGALLSRLRRDAGLTQVEVAGRMQVPQSFISKIESGERSLKAYEQFAYAKALDLDVLVFVAELEKVLSAMHTR